MNKKALSLVLIITTFTLCGCPKKNDDTKPLTGTIEERLEKLKCVTEVKRIGTSKYFQKVFKMKFTQYIDHDNKKLGTFTQHVELGFNGLDKPTDYVSSGYSIMDNNASWEDNENELAFTLGCNYLFVEHRYFDDSLPVEIDYNNNETWKYLTTKQAADDAHYIVSQFKRVLEGKWFSTGISKGGMTTELFAYYHPGDMDLYVPYVAPFCNSFTDKRMIKFVNEEAGDIQYGEETAAEMRNNVLAFQIKMLEWRNTLAPRFYNDGISQGATFSEYATQDNLYDASVLEFGIGFWQYYQSYSSLKSCLNMAENTASNLNKKKEKFYTFFTSICGPADLSVNGEYTPYYVQAYQELGNYGYDFSYIRNALPEGVTLTVSEQDEVDLAFKLALNETQYQLPHKELIYTKINNMLKTTDQHFIILYGSSDPWYSVRPDDVTGRSNISIYVNDNRPHTTTVANFDPEVRDEILGKIKTILQIA